jgi:hypothetical protein
LSGHPVQQRQEKLLILSGRGRKNAAEQQLGQLFYCQVTLYSRDRKTGKPVGQRQEKCSRAAAGQARLLSGHPVQQRQEKLLILSGRGMKNAAEQQLGQLVSCQVTLYSRDRKNYWPCQGRDRKNAAEQQRGQLVSCPVTLYSRDRKNC